MMLPSVRTTIDVADDVLQAARELAELHGETLGALISSLARKGLEAPAIAAPTRNGVPLLPRRSEGAPKPTMKLVNALRDEA
jgi:Ca2+/H+ antiporter